MLRTVGAFAAGILVGGVAVAVALVDELDALLEDEKAEEVKEGDMVQWESQGAYVFPEPKKVVSVESYGPAKFVMVEGVKTGIPIEQVFKVNI